MYITHQLKQNQRDQKGLGEDQLPDSRGMGEERLRPRSTLCAALAAARLCCVHRGRAHSEQAASAPLPASRSPTPASLRCACWVRTPRAALSPADHASAAEKLARNGSRSPLAALRASRGSRSRICFLAWRRGLVTGWLQVVGLLGWAGGGVTVGRLYWLGWV